MNLRIDDISANTNLASFKSLIDLIRISGVFDRIIVGVNILSKSNENGFVYPDAPFKDKNVDFFYNVDSFIELSDLYFIKQSEIASHGLLHFDHSKLDYKTQEISILTSCHFLSTKIFIPPFNKFNDDTFKICKSNGIELIHGWKSLDYEVLVEKKFDSNQKFWYMHPWRWSPNEFKNKVISKINRLIPSNT